MIEIRVPELAESITEATIVRWAKSEGEPVKQGEVLVELETDKVNMEISAEHDGVIHKILCLVGTVQVGQVIALLQEGQEVEKSEEKEPTPVTQKEARTFVQAAGNPTVIASPAARRIARDLNIPLSQVRSADPLGRVNAKDVMVMATEVQKPEIEKTHPETHLEHPVKSFDKLVDRVPMSKRRQTIANRLVEAQHNAAMLTTFNEVDMSEILSLRKRRGEAFLKQHDVKLGFMSFFTKAVVRALKQYPMVNAEINEKEFLIKKYYDIGIAVAAEEGLVVPVVRNADRLNFAELEQEIVNLANKARHNQLRLSDLQGGTFTITNGGTFGSLMSTPILNAPQVGILGMHKIQWRPVAIDEEKMENRPMMYIALSYDHRIIDGKEAVGFLVKVKELLEDPEVLLIEG
ncbi:MAG TPA: 2-oxoglutarate dehydrogenase complex dihydrolipoyllysine-residue succinyltransferase [Bacillota bacterium]|nr:2-oxoglutarate dehydrogenase complex dihydrolipoyllysine-residue succinyltransferase [Bacillota bacterium]